MAGVFLGAGTARAQRSAADPPSPVDDLLRRGRIALNDLRQDHADSIGRVLLALEDILERGDHIQVLQLIAAAWYPEVGTQSTDSAMKYLKALVRLAPTAAVPQEMSWPGLDSLLAEARSTTFGASAFPRA